MPRPLPPRRWPRWSTRRPLLPLKRRRLATRRRRPRRLRRRLEPPVWDPGRVSAQNHRLRKRARVTRPARFSSPVLLFPGVRRTGLPDYRLGFGPCGRPRATFFEARERRVERLRRPEKNPVAVALRQRRERRARLGEESRQAALGGGEIRAPGDARRAEFGDHAREETLGRGLARARFAHVVRAQLEIEVAVARERKQARRGGVRRSVL